MNLDTVIVGHVAIDVNVMPWGAVENVMGGAPTYAGLTLVALKKSVGITSKVGTNFVESFPPIYRKMGIDTLGIMVTGDRTTTFKNVYDEDGNREQVCEYVAAKISSSDIPEAYRSARSFYFSPIMDEITPDVIQSVKVERNIVMLDPQGLFRRIGKNAKVEIKPRRDIGEFLSYVDIVKIGKDELKAFKGSLSEILESLVSMGPKIAILTRGGNGCIVLSKEGLIEVPSLKVRVADLTGAGDVFGAAFLAKYLDTQNVKEATRFASIAAGMKIRYRGPTGFPSEEEVTSVLSRG